MNKTSLIILTFSFFLVSCSQFGEIPSGDHLEKIKISPNYDIEKEIFKNRRENIIIQMNEKVSFWNMTKAFLSNSAETIPENRLPEVKPPNIEEFMQSTEGIKFIWFGHSTLLVNIKNIIVLIDPVFSNAASPVSFIVERFQPPVLELKDLPRIDYILISHDHYDHLDMETVIYFKEKDVYTTMHMQMAYDLACKPRRFGTRFWTSSRSNAPDLEATPWAWPNSRSP